MIEINGEKKKLKTTKNHIKAFSLRRQNAQEKSLDRILGAENTRVELLQLEKDEKKENMTLLKM